MPALSLVQRKKIPMEQAVELSIELAPYLKAYNAYNNMLIDKNNSGQLPNVLCDYNHHRETLLDSLSPLSGGCLAYVFDMAMDNSMSALKDSAAYEALDDSFVEVLKNSVDEAIATHILTPNDFQSVNTLKATLVVTIDDKTNPANITISCVDNGRGFQQAFLEQVATSNARAIYAATAISHKLVEANLLSDIALFTGGRGLGLRMLMQKIDLGTLLDAERKYPTYFCRAPVSNIVFSNKIDALGKIEGAIISITTSKQPIAKVPLQRHEFEPKRAKKDCMETVQRNRSQSISSTLSIDTDPLDDTDQNADSPSPGSRFSTKS